MSSRSPVSPPLGLPLKYRRKSLSAEDSPPPNWSAIHRSSSPFTPSSPVPPTPTFASNHSYAHIQFSPSFDIKVREADDSSDGFTSVWDHNRRQYPSTKPRYSLPSFKSSFPSDDEPPLTSDFDISELSEDPDDIEYPSVNYRRHSDIGPGTSYLTDSEDEGPVIELDFMDQDRRGTFFSTSAERGRWKSDPIPFNNRLRNSNQISKSGLIRPTSEPAPVDNFKGRNMTAATNTLAHSDHEATDAQASPQPHPTTQEDEIYSSSPLPSSSVPMSPVSPVSFAPMSPLSFTAVSSVSSVAVSPMILETRLPDVGESEHTLRERVESELLEIKQDPVIVDPKIVRTDSLPEAHSQPSFPSSIPTVLNNTVAEAECSQTSGGSNPISPLLEPSLSLPTPGLQQDGPSPARDFLPSASPVIPTSGGLAPQNTVPSVLSPSPVASSSDPLPIYNPPSHPSSSSPKHKLKTLTQFIIPVDVTSTRPSSIIKQNQMCSYATSSVGTSDMDSNILSSSTSQLSGSNVLSKTNGTEKVIPGPTIKKAVGEIKMGEDLSTKLKGKEKDGEKSGSCESAECSKEKRKKGDEMVSDGPVRKKSRLFTERTGNARSRQSPETDKSISTKKDLEKSKPAHSLETKVSKVAVTQKTNASSSTKREPQKLKEDEHDIKRTNGYRRNHEDKCGDPTIASPPTKPPPNEPSVSSACPSAPLSPQATAALHAEIRGMLIESMASSRASSLPASSLYKAVMGSRPALKAQRGEKEWLAVFELVLKDGQKNGGVFGKVESSGKDHSDYPLEAQWFYVPERDEDQERAALIRSMMPRPGKRSTTKKYKQYYYRPLEKISRWDPEDEM